MPDVVLSDQDQECLSRLMSFESTPGSLPPEAVLCIIDRLVPSDSLEIDLADSSGCVIAQVRLSSSGPPSSDPQVCDGPLMLGLVHQGRHPEIREVLRHVGLADGITLGFRCGSDHVVQLSIDRYRRPFSERDLAMLRMISPMLRRLMRTVPTTTLSTSLTMTERRVLQLVATGRSNADIAADLYVSVATVRKHLEHAYRKLGVHSRMAAVVAFEGRRVEQAERAELVERYA